MKCAALLALGLSLAPIGCKNSTPQPEETSDAAPKAEAEAEVLQSTAPPAPAPKENTIPAPKDVAAPPAGAEKSETGLSWVILKPATGEEAPGLEDKVTVHYTGWDKTGKMFDSSEVRGQPATFGVGRVIRGWTEGLQLMKVGEKRRFWIPADLAYGETPRRPGAPAGQLTFDVELLQILATPKAPEDVAAPSAGSKKTATGLAYKVLSEGKAGGKKPGPTSKVTVHYSGWDKSGKMFDSSVLRGQPATFALNQVIKGWTEGLQLMPEGAKYRFWIPGELAYGNEQKMPGRPFGQLTFDVELVGVE